MRPFCGSVAGALLVFVMIASMIEPYYVFSLGIEVWFIAFLQKRLPQAPTPEHDPEMRGHGRSKASFAAPLLAAVRHTEYAMTSGKMSTGEFTSFPKHAPGTRPITAWGINHVFCMGWRPLACGLDVALDPNLTRPPRACGR